MIKRLICRVIGHKFLKKPTEKTVFLWIPCKRCAGRIIYYKGISSKYKIGCLEIGEDAWLN